MLRRWGREMSHAISRRLQQLEAMTALADLDFLPFDSERLDDGAVLVTVAADVVLVIEPSERRTREDGSMNTTIVVTAVGALSDVGRP
jgi:hypothetical protein